MDGQSKSAMTGRSFYDSSKEDGSGERDGDEMADVLDAFAEDKGKICSISSSGLGAEG